MNEPGESAAATPVREWRRCLAARLFMLIAATGMMTAFLASPFFLQGAPLRWQDLLGPPALLLYAVCYFAPFRARLVLTPSALHVRNLREVVIPLEQIDRVTWLHWGLAIHTKDGRRHRSLAVDRIDFPRFWRSRSRGREARRAILHAVARRREEAAVPEGPTRPVKGPRWPSST
ncbi:hypothetical protein ACPCAB_12660 [Streptomyces koyangensis]|uniref:hypothetical protein n=1 Tax=Streptomyces koyangensis TaxID=188770 RepID=UPI003C2FCF9C